MGCIYFETPCISTLFRVSPNNGQATVNTSIDGFVTYFS